MRKEVEFLIKSCVECASHKPIQPPKAGRLISIPVSKPFEIVGISTSNKSALAPTILKLMQYRAHE